MVSIWQIYRATHQTLHNMPCQTGNFVSQQSCATKLRNFVACLTWALDSQRLQCNGSTKMCSDPVTRNIYFTLTEEEISSGENSTTLCAVHLLEWQKPETKYVSVFGAP